MPLERHDCRAANINKALGGGQVLLTAANLAVINYSSHDSGSGSSVRRARMMDWIYSLFLSDHKSA